MEILIIITLFGVVGVIINQRAMNNKLNDIYIEVTEIHNKMGGWSRDEDEED